MNPGNPGILLNFIWTNTECGPSQFGSNRANCISPCSECAICRSAKSNNNNKTAYAGPWTKTSWVIFNPLTSAAVSKPLEVIGSPTYVLACQEPTAPDLDINQTAGSTGRPSMWKNRCMHAAVCLLHAGQLNRAGDVAKSGEFLGEFSWEELFPMDVRGLFNTIDEAVVYPSYVRSRFKTAGSDR